MNNNRLSGLAVFAITACLGMSSFAQSFQSQAPNRSNYQTYSHNVHWSQQFKPNRRVMDFGAVPRASKQEVVFEFKNVLDQTIYLTGVRVSCGCTIAKILTDVVKPGEMAKIHARFDTMRFQGKKQATVSVSLRKDSPYREYSEVQFAVKGKIRQDVVFDPGEVSFRNVNPGESATRTVTIKYAGSPNWQIVDIKSSNKNIEVTKTELRRDRASRRIDYELSLKLSPEQGIGAFNDRLTIITNDQRQGQISVKIVGLIQPILKAAPVQLGVVAAGDKVERKLILKGSRPFEVRSIATGDNRIQFEPAQGKKTLHILKYSVDTSTVGTINSEIKIKTDDPGQPTATVKFDAQISTSKKTFTAGK